MTSTSSTSEEWLISPITGERIPAHKVQEHMRIGLLDPRWLEQRDRALGDRAAQDAVLAPGMYLSNGILKVSILTHLLFKIHRISD